MINRLVSPGR